MLQQDWQLVKSFFLYSPKIGDNTQKQEAFYMHTPQK